MGFANRQEVVGLNGGQSTGASRGVNAASAAVLGAEVIGFLSICGPIPLAWLWIGGLVYRATGSLAADVGVVFLGFLLSTIPVARALSRLDGVWITLRQRAGRNQTHGALTQVVGVIGTFVIVLFMVWYYVLSDAFVLPFMPTH
jgi:hypothetical protein